jgi:putative transposase
VLAWKNGPDRWLPSFRFPEGSKIEFRKLSRKWWQAKRPKIGWVSFRWSRPLGGQVRNATVSFDGHRWYISFAVEDGLLEASPNGKPAVGIDRGVKIMTATSDGDTYHAGLIAPGEVRRILELQRSISRSEGTHGQKRRSSARGRLVATLGRIWARVRNRRAAW